MKDVAALSKEILLVLLRKSLTHSIMTVCTLRQTSSACLACSDTTMRSMKTFHIQHLCSLTSLPTVHDRFTSYSLYTCCAASRHQHSHHDTA